MKASMLSRICFVCITGTLEYMLVLSREVKWRYGLWGFVAVG